MVIKKKKTEPTKLPPYYHLGLTSGQFQGAPLTVPGAAGPSREQTTGPPRLASGGEQPGGPVSAPRAHLAAELLLVQGRALGMHEPSAVLGSLTSAGHLRGEATAQGARPGGTPALPRPSPRRVCAPRGPSPSLSISGESCQWRPRDRWDACAVRIWAGSTCARAHKGLGS